MQFVKYRESYVKKMESVNMNKNKDLDFTIQNSKKNLIKYFFRIKIKNNRGDNLLQH